MRDPDDLGGARGALLGAFLGAIIWLALSVGLYLLTTWGSQ